MTIPLGNSQRTRWNLQVQSLTFLSWVFLSTEKAYSSFPRLKNLELILFINTLLLHGLNPRPSLYNISAKNHLNCLQNLLFESLFLWVFVAIFGCGNIFDQRLLFDNKQLCIWPLELSEHYEPGNHSKNQRLKPLRNSPSKSREWRARFLDIVGSGVQTDATTTNNTQQHATGCANGQCERNYPISKLNYKHLDNIR